MNIRKNKLKKLNITDKRVSLTEDYFIPVRPNIRERRHKLEKIITIINEINKTKS